VAIGVAVTVALAAAVYVSYNANSSLPLQSRYRVYVDLPNADRLISTDEVRIAGIRVGQVSAVTAIPGRDGALPYARISLALEPSAGPLPVDTTAQARSASALGATYVELTLGRAQRTIQSGGTLSLQHAKSTVQLSDLLDIFDRSTAQDIQRTLGALAPALAGRGQAFNDLVGAADQLLPPLGRVAANLAAPATRLSAFLTAYASFAGALSPVADQLAGLVRGGAATFGALAGVRTALGTTIEELPPTESALTGALTRLDPSLDLLANFADELRPAAAMVPAALDQINSTLAAADPPLVMLPKFSGVLTRTLSALKAVSSMPSTDGAVRKLLDTVTAAGTTLELLTPAQLDCNAVGDFFASWGHLGDLGGGAAQDEVSFVLTSIGAAGSIFQNATPSSNLHVDYLPHETSQGCQAGNEPYQANAQDLANPPGNQPTAYAPSVPPPGVTELARRVGLLNAPEGTPR
jgi:phospholipid/cholesterol/gamma-HCH transport system substrate-binding protein